MFFINLLAKKLFLLIRLRPPISLFLSKAIFNKSIKHFSLSHLAWLQCVFPIRAAVQNIVINFFMAVPISYGKSDSFIIFTALNKVMLPYITNSHFPLPFDVFAIQIICHLQYAG